MYTLTDIIIYPIKSLPGISILSSEVEERGLAFDRRWMIIDENNRFITQRTQPTLTQLEIALDHDWIVVSDKKGNLGKIRIEARHHSDKIERVKIWDSECDAIVDDSEADGWFSEFLDQKVRLAYMPDSTQRMVNPQRVENKIVSFADGYPFLLLSEETVKDLNSKLSKPVSTKHFRPNLVIAGGNAFDEDEWDDFKIGDIKFRGVKECIRCKIIGIDPETGIESGEVSKVLKSYRMTDDGIAFGQNLVADNSGKIRVGYAVTVSNFK